jgi:hypothetical protein
VRQRLRPDAEEQAEQDAHRGALVALQEAGLAPMVGGAYALRVHTGIWRDTKDLDLFLRKDRIDEALLVLDRAGYRTEYTDRLWIAKAYWGEYFVDLIFSSGNGIAVVDEHWPRRASTADVLGVPSLIVPAEEMIWSKGFIQERERFDGADIHHLLRCKGAKLDWEHVLSRFGERHWEVLFVHLVTFRFAFPSDKEQVPGWVMRELLGRMQRQEDDTDEKQRICRGTLLSRQQYLHETNVLGYRDSRETETAGWTGDHSFPVEYPKERSDADSGGR